MKFFKRFGSALKDNVKRDVDHLNGDGAVEKADIIYHRIKSMFSGTWNLIVDKIINLLIKSASKDVIIIVKECKSAGLDPMNYLPDNIREKMNLGLA